MRASRGPVHVAAHFLMLSTALFLATPADAQNVTVGKANRVLNLVSASTGDRRLAPADPVFASEFIRAGERSHGEIILNDNSKLLVGENSQVALDSFVLGDSGFRSATLNVAQGAFRYISGNSPRGTFTFRTPLSSIGVRGTIFDVYVEQGGATNVVLLQGSVQVCAQNNACITADRACDVIRVASASEVTQEPFLRSARRPAQQENSLFSLLAGQGRFDRQFRVPTIACNARAAEEAREAGRNGNRGGEAPDNGFGGEDHGGEEGEGYN